MKKKTNMSIGANSMWNTEIIIKAKKKNHTGQLTFLQVIFFVFSFAFQG